VAARVLSKKHNGKKHEIIIQTLGSYGYEGWSLILKQECRLPIFQKRMLRKIYGPKWDEIIGGKRKLPNIELRKLVLLAKYCHDYG
jgi:hypothetical protein